MEKTTLRLCLAFPLLGALVCAPCRAEEPGPAVEDAFRAADWEQIEAEMAAWTDRDGFLREASVIRGYAALALGDGETARRHFLRGRGARPRDSSWLEAIADQHPEAPVARLLAGDHLVRQRDLPAALRHLDAALVADPELSLARLARGALRVEAEEGRLARTDLDALAHAGGAVAVEALVVRSLAWLEMGELGAAIVDLNHALALDSRHAVAFNTRGVVRARAAEWQEAMDDFAEAFRLAPELREARHNWQLAQRAAEQPGFVLASQRSLHNITLVTGEPGNRHTALASASDIVRLRTGYTPSIVSSVSDALALPASQPVVMWRSVGGLAGAAGDSVLRDLGALAGRASLNVMSFGSVAADRTTMGIVRHLNTAPSTSRVEIKSIQLVDFSELHGPIGKTPLGVTNNTLVAQRAAELGSRGLSVTAYTTQGKWGLQHLGNVKAMQELGVPTFATPYQGRIQPGVGLSIASFSLAGGGDSASSRAGLLGSRDWFHYSGPTQTHITSSFPELAARHLGGQLATTLPGGFPGSVNPGGVSIGPVSIARGAGGRIAFRSGETPGGELILVSALYGAPGAR